MKTYLVTGGAGFVGSHLAIALKQRLPSARVIALDNLKRRGSELCLARLSSHGVEFVHGDVRVNSDLEVSPKVDVIIECSAEPSVLTGYGASGRYVLDSNLFGLVNCLEVARRSGAAVLFLSTSRVYPFRRLGSLKIAETDSRYEFEAAQDVPGASGVGIAEDFPLDGARSLYGATKLAGELLLQEYVEMYGIPAVINRCGVIAGPWQMGKVDQGFVTFWAARHYWGDGLQYLGYGGSGKQVRDVLHIDDLIELVDRQLPMIESFRGEVFNVGGGVAGSVSLLELTVLCTELTGRRVPIERVPDARPADIPVYLSDCRRVTGKTGWRPRRTVRDTVEDIVRWIRDHADRLEPVLRATL